MSFLNCACSRQNNSALSSLTPIDKNRSHDNTREKLFKENDESKMATGKTFDYKPVVTDYELYAVIGKGHSNMSTITLAKHVPSNSLIAVKRINLELWDRELSYLQNEIVLSQQLSHPNLLPFHCSFITDQDLWAIMPLMAFGSCRDLMHAYFSSGLPEQTILIVLRSVLLAIDYLHQQGIIHRAIKASHVLISRTGQVCLSGLHNSYSMMQNGKRLYKVHHFPDRSIDCLHCYSPELLQQNLAGYSTKSDIYSIGILACELANGQSPFSDMPATQMLVEKLNGTKPRLADASTVSEFVIDDEGTDEQQGTPQEKADAIFFQRKFSPHLHDLASICLEQDPHIRPSATQLKEHPVFKSIKNVSATVLPSLLHPVTPLTDISRAPKDLSVEDEDDFARKMSEVSMLDDWSF